MTSPGISAVLSPELGKYHLIAELARGGMCNVYLAIAQGPGGFHKLLVVKELRPEFAEDETYVAMFLEEARLAARLTHPNIVQTNEVGSDGNRHYMIMEYLDGRSLYRVAKRLAMHGELPVGAHLRVISETLRGLHYAHELPGFDGEPLGIVHRDVSPLNVLVTFDGQVKLLDFGIAKAVDSALETQAGILKGRIAYMAPEQARGGQVDRRADVYAAGVMIWEAVARRRLWRAMGDVEILTRTLGEGPPRLRAICPAAPSDLDALCARAMSSSPADRHPTAAALFEDLEEHLARRDDAMSMREIGDLLSRTFEPERLRMKAIIEDTLSRTRSAPRSGVVPTLRVRPLGSGAPSVTPTRGPGDDLASVASFLAATPSDQLPAGRSTRSISAFRSPRPTVPDRPARPRGHGKHAAIAAGTLAAACLCLVLAIVHGREDGQRGGTAALPPEPTAAPAGTAQRALDPVLPATPSAVGSAVQGRTIVNDPTPAPRYAPTPRWVPTVQRAPRYDSAELGRTVPASADTPAGAAAGAHQEVDPGGGRAPLRPIVTSNPYSAQ